MWAGEGVRRLGVPRPQRASASSCVLSPQKASGTCSKTGQSPEQESLHSTGSTNEGKVRDVFKIFIALK